MNRSIELKYIPVFIEVARNQSFVAASRKLGITPAAVSQSIQKLEDQIGARLFVRTTRNVNLTDAGKTYFQRCQPALEQLLDASSALADLASKPTGVLRITVSHVVAEIYIQSILREFLETYPSIQVEIHFDDALTDLVKEGFDLGIRTYGFVEKDMIAINLGPMRLAVCGTSQYFKKLGKPAKLEELKFHNCINYRDRTDGQIMPWEFMKGGKFIQTQTRGNIVLDDAQFLRTVAIEGVGLVQLIENHVRSQLKAGELIEVLEKFSLSFEGVQLYYPNRKNLPTKIKVFADFIVQKARAQK